jgi:hypothetical protein
MPANLATLKRRLETRRAADRDVRYRDSGAGVRRRVREMD